MARDGQRHYNCARISGSLHISRRKTDYARKEALQDGETLFKGWNSQTVRKAAASTVNTIRIKIKTVSESVNRAYKKEWIVSRHGVKRYSPYSEHLGDNTRQKPGHACFPVPRFHRWEQRQKPPGSMSTSVTGRRVSSPAGAHDADRRFKNKNI